MKLGFPILALAVLLISPSGQLWAEGSSGKSRSIDGRWTEVSRYELPESLVWSQDLRALADGSLLLAASSSGAFRWHPAKPSQEPRLVARRGPGLRELWLVDSLGFSAGRFVVAAPFHALGWGRVDSKTDDLEEVFAMEHVVDLDLRGDRLLLLGAQRGDDGAFAPDGAIAWLGEVGKDPAEARPVLYAEDGPGAADMGACGMMMIGAARFLADGSFWLVPGVEGGVFHFDPEGKLLRTWSSQAAGFDAGCGLSEKEMFALSVDEPGRWAWTNRRTIVDEIVPLPKGPALVLREVGAEGVRWRLASPKPSGRWTSTELPLRSPSELTHVKATVDGERVLFLLWAWGVPPGGPAVPPEIVVLERAR